MSSKSTLDSLARRLSERAQLADADMRAILALPHVGRTVDANTFLVREGDRPQRHCSVIVSGMAFRHKLTAEGARQIVSLHLPGDLLDLQHLFLNVVDHSVQALTELKVVDIDRKALREIILNRPAVAYAVWVDGLIDSSINREWVLNVGRRDAQAKVAHLLCEMAVRMRAAGIIDGVGFQLPMTQEQLGDATGLTSVHVNRTIKSLVAGGLIDHGGRSITIVDWDALRRVGDFNPLYLHLDQVAPQFSGSLGSLFLSRVSSSKANLGHETAGLAQ